MSTVDPDHAALLADLKGTPTTAAGAVAADLRRHEELGRLLQQIVGVGDRLDNLHSTARPALHALADEARQQGPDEARWALTVADLPDTLFDAVLCLGHMAVCLETERARIAAELRRVALADPGTASNETPEAKP